MLIIVHRNSELLPGIWRRMSFEIVQLCWNTLWSKLWNLMKTHPLMISLMLSLSYVKCPYLCLRYISSTLYSLNVICCFLIPILFFFLSFLRLISQYQNIKEFLFYIFLFLISQWKCWCFILHCIILSWIYRVAKYVDKWILKTIN